MNFLNTKISFPNYVPMTAWLEHGPFAMWLVQAMKPRLIVELGSHYGYSYFAMCEAVRDASLNTQCFAVDTWAGDEHSGYYDESVYERVVQENRQYAHFSTLLRKTFLEALEDVEDGSVDILHIDGSHFFEDVKEDFESWVPKLSSSAVVLLHDTAVRERNFGVHQFWKQVKHKRNSLNFRHCHGLGVLFWGEKIAEGLQEFVKLAADHRVNETILALFDTLGSRMRAERALSELEGVCAQKDDDIIDLTNQRVGFLANQGELATALDQRNLELATIRQERDEQVNKLRHELAEARKHPWKSLRRKHISQILYFLARFEGIFSARRRKKFLHSAWRRDPKRSLFGLVDTQARLIKELELGAAGTQQGPAGTIDANISIQAIPRKNGRTVLVVSHEASRTGAPILALNLVRELAKRNNVVAITLGGGELIQEFISESAELLQLDRIHMPAELITERVVDFVKQHEVSTAFVNSVESRCVLPGLKVARVLSVALLHEFASYTRPVSAFQEVFSAADQIVFSTEITLANALARPGVERPVNVHVLPQGKCLTRFEQTAPNEAEQRWLDNVLRPSGRSDRQFVVLGAGTIETRKGIDLFIEVATRIISGPNGGKFRFVWVGNGYDPQNDTLRSVYLADQIVRAGVQAQLKIVRATSEIEHAYACADIMLLSSRLDPLPNVAIDMLLAGKPVMCFDRTTGIADFLAAIGLKEDCVANYLDTNEMACKLQALADNPDRLTEVAEIAKAHAQAVFDFDAYTRRLELIAEGGGRKTYCIEQDLLRIRESKAFRADFVTPRSHKAGDEDSIIRWYLEANRSGPYLRKPKPGFNQLIYAEENGWGKAQDPFTQFIDAGQPEGRWKSAIIDNTSSIELDAMGNVSIALHIHAFYFEEFNDIISRLMINRARPTLFVSTPESQVQRIYRALECYDGHVSVVKGVPNRGRDIAPFLTLFGPDMIADFDIIGHLHTKSSTDIGDRLFVANCVEFLMENTLGGPKGGAMLDRIVSAMLQSPDLGIVYPDDPNLIGWSDNKAHAVRIAARMGVHDLPEHINFPVGTMFWARSDLIKRFVALGLDWNDYPAEPLPHDGSALHALERLFGVIPAHAGFRTGVTNIPGVTNIIPGATNIHKLTR